MSAQLGSFLLHEQQLRPDQLDDLLQLQVISGGSLDTNILEASLLTEEQMLRALGESMRMPTVTKEDIDDIAAKIPEIFPRVFAETYRLVPYRLVGRNLGVLVNEMPDAALIAKLQQRLHINIVPAATTEARLYYAMHRLYGVELPPRMGMLLTALDQALGGEAAAPPPVEPSAAEPIYQLEATRPPLDREEPIELEGALRRLQLGHDRDQAIDVVLAFASQTFQFAGLFVVNANAIVGYRGRGDATACTKLPRLSVPLILPSMFKTVFETQGHYLGQVPAASLNKSILADLGRGEPKTVLLAPFTMNERVRGMIYADNGRRGVSSKRVADILLLMTRLGPAFERLIQRRKAEVKVALGTLGEEAQKLVSLDELTAPEPLPEPVFQPAGEILPEVAAVAEPMVQSDAPMPAPVPLSDLLSKRLLNVLQAAAEVSEEEYEAPKPGEEEVDLDGISADALLGKEPPRVEPRTSLEAEPPHFFTKPTKATAPVMDPSERAFVGVDSESAADNLEGWQDVLVDTIATGKQGGSPDGGGRELEPPPTPPPVDWADVMVQSIEPKAPLAPEPAPFDDMSILLDALESPDPDAAKRAAEELWKRNDRLPALLGPRFPGRLSVDPFGKAGMLPPLQEMSQVLRLLCGLGQAATDAVLPHLDSQYPVHRLLATAFFGQVVSAAAFSKLLRRLFDEEPRVRESAADALRRYRNLAGYEEGLQKIRDRLSLPVFEAQVRATEILGRLRDSKAIPLLIPLTAHKRPELCNGSLGALMRLTAADHGNNPKKWTEWWVKHSDEPRESWLIEGLRKKEPILRVIADEELRALSGLTFQFDPGADKKAQEAAVRGWEAWWESETRHRSKKKNVS